jgi:hypothetical protein
MQVIKKSLVFVLILLIIQSLGLAYADKTGEKEQEGDVYYNYRVDDKNNVWVDVENDGDKAIKVTSVVVSFYDKDDNVLSKETLDCQKDCTVDVDKAETFGPIAGPNNWETVRVTKLYYEEMK